MNGAPKSMSGPPAVSGGSFGVNSSTTGEPVYTQEGCGPFVPGCPIAGGGGGNAPGTVPYITSISPSTIMIGSSNVQLTINGSGFTSNPTVNLPSGVSGSNQSAIDTQITLTVNVAYSSNIGNNNLSVTANGAQSNTTNLVIDGPAYMTVNLDTWGYCHGCNTTVERDVYYRIHNFSGSSTNLANQTIGEVPSTGTDTCSPQQVPSFTTCSSGLGFTDGSGSFEDVWSLNIDNVSPPGCGVPINYDHWQMCFSGHPREPLKYSPVHSRSG